MLLCPYTLVLDGLGREAALRIAVLTSGGRVPLQEVVGSEWELDPDLYKMAEVLAELPE